MADMDSDKIWCLTGFTEDTGSEQGRIYHEAAACTGRRHVGRAGGRACKILQRIYRFGDPQGKTEAEVLAQLGDPRLLARSIVDAGKRAGTAYGSDYEYDEEVAGEVRDDGRGRTGSVQRVMLPGWLVMLIIVVIAVVVIGLVSSLLYIFAPVIIAGLIVTLVVRLIRDKK